MLEAVGKDDVGVVQAAVLLVEVVVLILAFVLVTTSLVVLRVNFVVSGIWDVLGLLVVVALQVWLWY